MGKIFKGLWLLPIYIKQAEKVSVDNIWISNDHFFHEYSSIPMSEDIFIMMIPLLSELSYAWIFNEYPSYQDNRRFVSQETGNLYIAKVEKSDVGNYTCVVTNTVTNHKVLGPPTPLILRNDGEFPKGFCVLWLYVTYGKLLHYWHTNSDCLN